MMEFFLQIRRSQRKKNPFGHQKKSLIWATRPLHFTFHSCAKLGHSLAKRLVCQRTLFQHDFHGPFADLFDPLLSSAASIAAQAVFGTCKLLAGGVAPPTAAARWDAAPL